MDTVRTLNDIPDSLQEPEEESWTPARGIAKGAVFGALVSVLLAGVVGVATYYLPVLTYHWLLGGAMGFFCTRILFSVVHWAAGMVGSVCTAMVWAGMSGVLFAKHAALVLSIMSTPGSSVTIGALFSIVGIFAFQYNCWIGVGIATLFYRDGAD